MNGEAAQATSHGPAIKSISGLISARTTSVAAAKAGAKIIARNVSVKPPSLLRSESLAVVHSSNRRFVQSIRTNVRTIASTQI